MLRAAAAEPCAATTATHGTAALALALALAATAIAATAIATAAIALAAIAAAARASALAAAALAAAAHAAAALRLAVSAAAAVPSLAAAAPPKCEPQSAAFSSALMPRELQYLQQRSKPVPLCGVRRREGEVKRWINSLRDHQERRLHVRLQPSDCNVLQCGHRRGNDDLH